MVVYGLAFIIKWYQPRQVSALGLMVKEEAGWPSARCQSPSSVRNAVI